MQCDRAAGVLLHITSLPDQLALVCQSEGDSTRKSFGEGSFSAGVGDLGPAAFAFVEFLKQAGQRVWQVLPLGPTVHGNSPYSCYSAFAGNPLLISKG